MSVEFDDSSTKYSRNSYRGPGLSSNSSSGSGISGWLVRKGIVQDKAGADKVMLIVAVVFFLLSVAVFIFK